MEQLRNKKETFENNQKENSRNGASIISQSNNDLIVFPLNQNNDEIDDLKDRVEPNDYNQIKRSRIKKNKKSSTKSLKNGNKNSNKFLDLLHFIILYSFGMFVFYLFFSFIASLFGKQYWPFN
jgi:hypothetical protein